MIMCDYSLESFKSRPAVVGDRLVVRGFVTGTTGFVDTSHPRDGAVCLLPGTELAFDEQVMLFGSYVPTKYKTAIFRKVNEDKQRAHHDALELPNGDTVLLTNLSAGQRATVLQLPAKLRRAKSKRQRRVETVG
jgi:hypothetical protein